MCDKWENILKYKRQCGSGDCSCDFLGNGKVVYVEETVVTVYRNDYGSNNMKTMAFELARGIMWDIHTTESSSLFCTVLICGLQSCQMFSRRMEPYRFQDSEKVYGK